MEVDLLDCNDNLADKVNGEPHNPTCLSAGNSDIYCSTVSALDCIKKQIKTLVF